MLGEQSHQSPHGHQDTYHDQKRDPACPVLSVLDTLGGLSPAMFPPGEAVADEQGEPETNDQFREQVFDVEEVAHFKPR